MLSQRQEWEAACDINLWFLHHNGICPNCGLDLKKCHPLCNIVPHWYGDCKRTQGENDEADMERR
jgi:predicted amidophosphoribosyltransferase